MSSAARRRGATFETDLLRHIRTTYVMPAERLRLTGRKDEGDIAVVDPLDGFVYLLEAKAERTHDFASAVIEVMAEAEHYAAARGLDRADVMGLTVHKRPGKPLGQAYVVTTLDEFFAH